MGLSSASGQHINCIFSSTLSSMLNVKCGTYQSCVLVGGSARGCLSLEKSMRLQVDSPPGVGQVPFGLL